MIAAELGLDGKMDQLLVPAKPSPVALDGPRLMRHEGHDRGIAASASRVVHQGHAGVIREYLALGPVFAGQEGEGTVVDKATDPHRYRLLGKVGGTPPYRGVVIHRGWKTTKLALPRYSKPVDRSAENVITPMEIEVR